MTKTTPSIIQDLRGMGISSARCSDSNLRRLIELAVDKFSNYFPRYAHSTFTTVKDQQAYDLPLNAIAVMECGWSPSGQVIPEVKETPEIQKIGEAYFEEPSQAIIYRDKLAHWRRQFGGWWEERADQLWLYPCPDTTGTKVALLCIYPQTLASIADSKQELFYMVLQWMVYDTMATSLIGDAEGDATKVTIGSYSKETRKDALIKEYRAKAKDFETQFLERAQILAPARD